MNGVRVIVFILAGFGVALFLYSLMTGDEPEETDVKEVDQERIEEARRRAEEKAELRLKKEKMQFELRMKKERLRLKREEQKLIEARRKAEIEAARREAYVAQLEQKKKRLAEQERLKLERERLSQELLRKRMREEADRKKNRIEANKVALSRCRQNIEEHKAKLPLFKRAWTEAGEEADDIVRKVEKYASSYSESRRREFEKKINRLREIEFEAKRKFELMKQDISDMEDQESGLQESLLRDGVSLAELEKIRGETEAVEEEETPKPQKQVRVISTGELIPYRILMTQGSRVQVYTADGNVRSFDKEEIERLDP